MIKEAEEAIDSRTAMAFSLSAVNFVILLWLFGYKIGRRLVYCMLRDVFMGG